MKKQKDPRWKEIQTRKQRLYENVVSKDKPNARFFIIKVIAEDFKGGRGEFWLQPADYSSLSPILHKEIVSEVLHNDLTIAKIRMENYAKTLDRDFKDHYGHKILSLSVVQMEGHFSIREKLKYKL